MQPIRRSIRRSRRGPRCSPEGAGWGRLERRPRAFATPRIPARLRRSRRVPFRSDRRGRAGRGVVTSGRRQELDAKHRATLTKLDRVSVLQDLALDADAVDEGAVAAAHIHHQPPSGLGPELRMVSGDIEVSMRVEGHLASGHSSNANGPTLELERSTSALPAGLMQTDHRRTV